MRMNSLRTEAGHGGEFRGSYQDIAAYADFVKGWLEVAEGSQFNHQSYVSGRSKANSFKFDTVVWLIAGLLIPVWPISLIFCWYMAYRSYKRAR